MRLIDADALIAETMKNRCDDCDRRKGIKRGKITFVYDFGEVPCRACDVGDMIEILDEAPTVATDINVPNKWISVKDRLPDVGETVLFTGINSYGNRVRTQQGYFNGGVWMWISDGNRGLANDTITHWMPLPEPPKEETDGHNSV